MEERLRGSIHQKENERVSERQYPHSTGSVIANAIRACRNEHERLGQAVVVDGEQEGVTTARTQRNGGDQGDARNRTPPLSVVTVTASGTALASARARVEFDSMDDDDDDTAHSFGC